MLAASATPSRSTPTRDWSTAGARLGYRTSGVRSMATASRAVPLQVASRRPWGSGDLAGFWRAATRPREQASNSPLTRLRAITPGVLS